MNPWIYHLLLNVLILLGSLSILFSYFYLDEKPLSFILTMIVELLIILSDKVECKNFFYWKVGLISFGFLVGSVFLIFSYEIFFYIFILFIQILFFIIEKISRKNG